MVDWEANIFSIHRSLLFHHFAWGPGILLETGFSLALVLLKKYIYCTAYTPQYGQLQDTGRSVLAGHKHEKPLWQTASLFIFNDVKHI